MYTDSDTTNRILNNEVYFSDIAFFKNELLKIAFTQLSKREFVEIQKGNYVEINEKILMISDISFASDLADTNEELSKKKVVDLLKSITSKYGIDSFV